MSKFLHRFWPVLFILILWFVFSSPYFIKGLVPYPSKYQVTFFHPWSVYEQWWGPVKNNAMPDIITQIYPWKHFTIESLKSGQIPFWNPYNFAGNSHIGNFQSAVFSPFNLLYFLFPFIDAWSINILLQPLLAGLFTYLLLRTLRTSEMGSLIGAITFMFSGFIVVWMAYGTLGAAILFLPLALYGVEKGFLNKKYKFFVLISISIAFSFFSGHIQTSFYLAVFILLYIIFKGLTTKDKKGIIYACFFYVIGFIVSLIQLYPTYVLFINSARSSSLYSGGGIPWNYLITIIAPDFYGNPVTRNDWVGNYAEWAGFVGIVPLFLAFFGGFLSKHKHTAFFLIAAIVALIFSMETPLHSILVLSRIPILATSIPSRVIVLFSFSIAVLAGFGMDLLQKNINQNQYKKIFAVVLLYGLFLILIWLTIMFGEVLPHDKVVISMKNLILPTLMLIFLGTIMLVNKIIPNKLINHISFFILLALVSFDSLRFAQKWMPFDPKELVYPDVQVIKEIKKKIGFGRVFGNMGTEVSSYYGISSIEGYDPLYIQRYGEFVRFASTGSMQEAERSVAKLDRVSKSTKRALDLLGVDIIYHPIADTNTSWAFPVWQDGSRYNQFYNDEKFELYKNISALPRVKLFYEYEVISVKDKILQRIFDDSFDIKRSLVLEKDPDIHFSNVATESGKVVIESYGSDRIRISVDTPKDALLYLSDNYYPSWKGYVNGKEVEIYRANYTFRAMVVPMGKSIVEFKYEYF